MTQFFNRREETDKRRLLRKEMRPAEELIWARLRGKQVLGCKFRRQYSAGAYVIDFYCPALKLAIEIDGNSHFEGDAPAYDADRQRFIESLGICFRRFQNAEVYHSLDDVLMQITDAVSQALSNLGKPCGDTSYSPPYGGGAGGGLL